MSKNRHPQENEETPAAPMEEWVTGTIKITRSGNGFLIPDDSALPDVYVGEAYLGPALDGDKVKVKIDSPSGRGPRVFGHIVDIVERNTAHFVAVVTPDRKARPEDPKNPFDYIIRDFPDGLKADTKILVETLKFPGDGEDPVGRVVEILGPAGAPQTEIAAILAGFQAPGPFPEAVKDEARGFINRPLDLKGREDLTELLTCTIDPESARDFDDALSCEFLENGNLRIGVHIADVSQYVRPGNKLDEEARARSTSIYLPERVIPMLPEELSNDVCSLRPGEPRLTKTVFIEFTPAGERARFTIRRTVIKSAHRLTYKQVRRLLEDEAEAAAFPDAAMLSALRAMNTLAQTLRARRIKNGSLELNMEETVILFDADGNATGLAKVENDFSHQLVEEFMLAANICVAEWAKANGLPVLHRVHEPPAEEAMEELADFLNASGYVFKPPFKRDRLQKVIDAAREKPEEHAINLAILKSFNQAIYDPRGDIGHYALNFPSYLHFTSPIRRYPDLQLHQMLDTAFGKGKACKLPQKLRKAVLPPEGESMQLLGEHCSALERRAMKIEEACKDFRRLEILSRASEREFTAVVTGIRKFGVFVEIENYFVEGMLPRWQIERLGYTTKEVTPNARGKDAKGFSLGQEVRVRVTGINLGERMCEMEFLGKAKN